MQTGFVRDADAPEANFDQATRLQSGKQYVEGLSGHADHRCQVGFVWVDQEAVQRHALKRDEVERCTAQARAKVERRVGALRGERPFPTLAGRTTILVDDGIAAGSTLRTAISALRARGASDIVVAVPTGHSESVQRIAALADAVYCANIRGGYGFAVADAFEAWEDVDEATVRASLNPDKALP